MAKKNILFCATLLCSTLGSLVSSKIVANQNLTNIDCTEITDVTKSDNSNNAEIDIQQSMQIIEQTYQAAIKAYDKDAIEKYEQNLNDSIKEYFLACAQDKEYAKNIGGIEQEVTEMTESLSAVTNEDHAYATSYAIFMVTISKVLDQLEDKVQEENLTEALDEIGKFVEEFYLSRLTQQDQE